jgi:5,10-methylene-tetrahydrofolate dehydrogenase/methenyl tetrahydrofolate cyclohydrolase
MVAEMLIQIASERKNKVIKPKSTSIDIGIDAIPTNTVAGEMDIEAEPLTLAQFIKE